MTLRNVPAFLVLLVGFLAAASGLTGPPWTSLPFDGKMAAARAASDLHAAVSLYEAHPDWPFLRTDLLAAALSYYDLLEFAKALPLLKRLKDDPQAAAHLLSLDATASEDVLAAASRPLGHWRALLLEAVHRKRATGSWGKPEQIDFDPAAVPLPTFLPLVRIRAEALTLAGKPVEAYGLLMRGLQRFDRYLPFFLYAVKLINDTRSDGPVPTFLERAAALGADPFTLAFEYGRYYKNRGDLKTAEKWFSRAIALKPADARAWLMRGDCRRFTGRRAEAIEDYRTAYNHDPTLTVALVNLAILSFESGEIQVAAQLFDEAVAADPSFASAWVERANFKAAIGLMQEAEKDYLEAARLTPKDPYPLFRLAEAWLRNGDYEAARRYAEAALERKSDYAPALVVLGDAARSEGDMRTAASYYRRALDSSPGDFTAARSLAAALLTLRDVKGARAAAMTALAAFDKDPLSNYVLAMTDLARGRFEAARSRLRFLLDDDIGYAPAWYGLALLEFATGRTAIAVSRLETAIRWKPDPAWVLFRAQLALLDPAFAMDDAERVISLLADPADRLLVDVARAALAKDVAALRSAVAELSKIPSRAKLAAVLEKALNARNPSVRPPSMRPPQRTVACFYLALVLYARGREDAASRMLRFNLRSNDYLTPEYHLSAVLAARLEASP